MWVVSQSNHMQNFLETQRSFPEIRGFKIKENVKLSIKSTKYFRNKNISYFFRLVQIKHNDIKID